MYYRAKYPLAHITKALDVMEDNLLFGSDIGCSLKKTITLMNLVSWYDSIPFYFCIFSISALTLTYYDAQN